MSINMYRQNRPSQRQVPAAKPAQQLGHGAANKMHPQVQPKPAQRPQGSVFMGMRGRQQVTPEGQVM